MSSVILIFLSLLFSVDNTIYIVTNDNFESKVIKSELSRDWTKISINPIPDMLYDMQDHQCILYDKVVIIDSYDSKEINKHRVPRLSNFPQYRVGEYKEFQEFDKRTFTASGTALTTIFTIKNNSDADLSSWKDKCEKIERDAMYAHIQKVIIFGQTKGIAEINDIYYFEEGYEEEAFKDIIKKHETLKDFPLYVPPKLPESPILKFPWER